MSRFLIKQMQKRRRTEPATVIECVFVCCRCSMYLDTVLYINTFINTVMHKRRITHTPS